MTAHPTSYKEVKWLNSSLQSKKTIGNLFSGKKYSLLPVQPLAEE
jgi:hypothetical protein